MYSYIRMYRDAQHYEYIILKKIVLLSEPSLWLVKGDCTIV